MECIGKRNLSEYSRKRTLLESKPVYFQIDGLWLEYRGRKQNSVRMQKKQNSVRMQKKQNSVRTPRKQCYQNTTTGRIQTEDNVPTIQFLFKVQVFINFRSRASRQRVMAQRSVLRFVCVAE